MLMYCFIILLSHYFDALSFYMIQMTLKFPRKTSVPRTNYQEHINNMQASRLEQLRASVLPTFEVNKNSPLNPKIMSQKVINNVQPALTARRLIPTKNNKLPPGDSSNVALYATKGQYTVNAENVLGSTYMAQRLKDMKEQRMMPAIMERSMASYGGRDFHINQRSPTSISLASNDYNPASANTTIDKMYNPMLPDSDTNVRLKDLQPVVDERIDQKRCEHEWLYESDQAALNLNAFHDPHRRERNRMQEEAYQALNHELGLNRWTNDARKTYLHNDTTNNITFDVKDRVTRAHFDELSPATAKDIVISGTREAYDPAKYDITGIDRLTDAERKYDPVRAASKLFKDLVHKAKKEAFNADADDTSNTSTPNIIEVVAASVKGIFGIKQQKTHKSNREDIYDDTPIDTLEAFNSNLEGVLTDAYSDNFKLGDKNTQHIRLVINRDYSKPIVTNDAEDTAYSIVMLDDQQGLQLKKATMYAQDGKFIVLRQLEHDKIMKDTSTAANDVFVTTIPFEALDTSFRQHIEYLNPLYNTRSQPLRLTYDDMCSVLEFIEEHPNVEQRLTIKQALDNIRSMDYDRDIKNGFTNNNSMFIEGKVLDRMTDTIRKRISDKQRGRAVNSNAIDDTLDTTTNANSKALNLKTRVSIDPQVTPRAGYIGDFKGVRYNPV